MQTSLSGIRHKQNPNGTSLQTSLLQSLSLCKTPLVTYIGDKSSLLMAFILGRWFYHIVEINICIRFFHFNVFGFWKSFCWSEKENNEQDFLLVTGRWFYHDVEIDFCMQSKDKGGHLTSKSTQNECSFTCSFQTCICRFYFYVLFIVHSENVCLVEVTSTITSRTFY